MDLLSAAASGPPLGALALLTILATGGYLVAAAVWPFTAHRRCNGTGKLRGPGGKSWRGCRGCAGTGQKVRAGRRGWDAVTNRTDTTTRKKR